MLYTQSKMFPSSVYIRQEPLSAYSTFHRQRSLFMSNNVANSQQKKLSDISFSVLDLSPIIEGGTPAEAFRRTLDLAQHVEQWGFNRYWLAEHHNIPGIASAATSVLMGYVAAHTSTIRLGSGGIMLPNHAPLMIAEQFGTLESLYPGRIDLGLGRAPGSDQLTARALRRDLRSGNDFPELLQELRAYFKPSQDSLSKVHAIPGEGLNVPIWLLGSSGFSAQLAGQLGLPFAFAGQFSPGYILPALELYREAFNPSEDLTSPYAMVGLNIIAADTDEEAQKLATSQTQANEIIVNAAIYDHESRLRSYQIVSDIWKDSIS